MPQTCTLGVVSDIHYAGPAERSRGNAYELNGIADPGLRLLVRAYRHFVWMRDPLSRGYLLDRFLAEVPALDHLVVNGDCSVDSAFVGLSDDAARESTRECLAKLRARFGAGLRLVCGDHELGKLSLFGARGGLRLESLRRARDELGFAPFWELRLGRWKLLGVTSSLVGLPVLAHDILPGERAEWERLRGEHLAQIREAFAALKPGERVLLFCHDPTALPFLAEEKEVASRFGQIEQTIIGHLHSNLVLWKSRLLSGMPRITFLGHTARKLSTALHDAKLWRPFKVRLCPALGGIELLKDGGYLVARLDPEAPRPPEFRFVPVSPRRPATP